MTSWLLRRFPVRGAHNYIETFRYLHQHLYYNTTLYVNSLTGLLEPWLMLTTLISLMGSPCTGKMICSTLPGLVCIDKASSCLTTQTNLSVCVGITATCARHTPCNWAIPAVWTGSSQQRAAPVPEVKLIDSLSWLSFWRSSVSSMWRAEPYFLNGLSLKGRANSPSASTLWTSISWLSKITNQQKGSNEWRQHR